VIPLHPHKDLIKIMKRIKMNMNMKMDTMVKFKRRGIINGEMRMMGIRTKATRDLHHHIKEYATPYKEITS
jgi:hypothetical protein